MDTKVRPPSTAMVARPRVPIRHINSGLWSVVPPPNEASAAPSASGPDNVSSTSYAEANDGRRMEGPVVTRATLRRGFTVLASVHDAHLAAVRAMIENERPTANDEPGLVGWMQQLCRAAAQELPAIGVGVSLISEEGHQVTFATSGPTFERIEELQFTMGEGPCIDAFASRAPVLIPDLAECVARWPGYAPAVQDEGVRAVFAFPLQVGAARAGALDVFRETTGALPASSLTLALVFAEVAMGSLLDAQNRAGPIPSVPEQASDARFELYQAQGMVMIQLGVGLPEAMARLRAYAYTNDRVLSDVADDIVGGHLRLDTNGAPEAPTTGR